MTDLKALKGDITTLAVDAIVNAANSSLMGGGGVDGAIHAAGGPSILEECRRIVAERGRLPTGQAVITGGGNLAARHVIHTVGPIWHEVTPDEGVDLLASCYRESLAIAGANNCRTVAFPGISTGVYGFPKDLASKVAVSTVRNWAEEHPDQIDEVTFVCFSDSDLVLYRHMLG